MARPRRCAGIMVLMIITSSQCGGTHQVPCQGLIMLARARAALPRCCCHRAAPPATACLRAAGNPEVNKMACVGRRGSAVRTARRVWADPRWPLTFGIRARRFFCAACKPRERKAEPAPARGQAEGRRAGRRVTGGGPWGMGAGRRCHARGEGGVGRDAVLCAPAQHELACVLHASRVGHRRLRLRQD